MIIIILNKWYCEVNNMMCDNENNNNNVYDND